MLCVTCKNHEGVLIGDDTRVTFEGTARVRIDAPPDVLIQLLDRYGRPANPLDKIKKAMRLKRSLANTAQQA